jgi:hypothetical protein
MLTPLLTSQRLSNREESAVAKDPQLRTVVDQDGAAILDVERGLISTLNPTGAYVWERLQRGETIETIILDLAHESGEEVFLVDRDVRVFIEALREKRLLHN